MNSIQRDCQQRIQVPLTTFKSKNTGLHVSVLNFAFRLKSYENTIDFILLPFIIVHIGYTNLST